MVLFQVNSLHRRDGGNMKYLFSFGTALFALFCNTFAQSDPPSTAMVNTARTGFVSYLTSAVTEETKTIIGFDQNDDLNLAVLGTPLRLYNLPADAVKNYDGSATVSSLIEETDRWYFPIIIAGKIKMMLYVAWRDGAWQRIGLGSAGLAREMQALLTSTSLKKGSAPILIMQMDIGNYLFSIPEIDPYNLTEAFTDFNSLPADRYGLLKKAPSTILQLQKRAVFKNSKEINNGQNR